MKLTQALRISAGIISIGLIQSLIAVFAAKGHFVFSFWVSLLYFFVTPAVLWILLLPWLSGKVKNLAHRNEASLQRITRLATMGLWLVPLHRLLALLFDFGLRSISGNLSTGFFEAIWDARVMTMLILPENFMFYLLLAGYLYVLHVNKQQHKPHLTGDKIQLHSREGVIMVDPKNVEFIEASGNNILLREQEHVHEVRMTMKAAENTFGAFGLLRIHRSAMINPAYIKSMKHWQQGNYWIIMESKKVLTSSRTYQNNFRALLG